MNNLTWQIQSISLTYIKTVSWSQLKNHMLKELKSLSLNHIIKVNKSTESKGLNFMNKIEASHS